MLSGTFRADGSFTMQEDIRWAAVYDGVSNGAVYQYPFNHAYSGSGTFKNSFWNRDYDHKLYLRIDPPTQLGAVFGYNHSLVGFQANASSWVQAAKAKVRGWTTIETKSNQNSINS